MGRTMPYECPHGAILDWGDFGPEDDVAETCTICDSEQPLMVDFWRLTKAIGDAFVACEAVDSPEYWSLIAELDLALPGLGWHNAISDHT